MLLSLNLILGSLAVFIFNIPFGYWRSNVPKLSIQWLLAIHIPVPFIVVLRISGHFGFHWSSFVLFVGAFILGQLSGNKLHHWLLRRTQCPHSSCLVMDVYRCLNH